MIYTIGHSANYRKAYAQYGELVKVGKREPGDPEFPDGYVGGYAFVSYLDAMRRIVEAKYRGFEVFGLLADWSNTTPSPTGWWHNLNHDAVIVLLEKSAKPQLGQLVVR